MAINFAEKNFVRAVKRFAKSPVPTQQELWLGMAYETSSTVYLKDKKYKLYFKIYTNDAMFLYINKIKCKKYEHLSTVSLGESRKTICFLGNNDDVIENDEFLDKMSKHHKPIFEWFLWNKIL